MLRYLFEDEVMGFLVSDDSEKEEIIDLDWISTDDGKEDRKGIFSCDSSSEEEMDDQPCFSASANYIVFKTKTWQKTTFANNTGRAAAHNFVRQSPGPTRFAKSQCSEMSDTFSLFLRSSLRKTCVNRLITKKS